MHPKFPHPPVHPQKRSRILSEKGRREPISQFSWVHFQVYCSHMSRPEEGLHYNSTMPEGCGHGLGAHTPGCTQFPLTTGGSAGLVYESTVTCA